VKIEVELSEEMIEAITAAVTERLAGGRRRIPNGR
jgi:hypothetical protein